MMNVMSKAFWNSMSTLGLIFVVLLCISFFYDGIMDFDLRTKLLLSVITVGSFFMDLFRNRKNKG